jgi:hypothetical protein
VILCLKAKNQAIREMGVSDSRRQRVRAPKGGRKMAIYLLKRII